MPARPPSTPPDPPSESAIRELIGPALYPFYQHLLQAGPFRPEWKYYGAKSGWTLKLFEGKRNLCFIRPEAASLHVAFILGDAAAEELLAGAAAPALKEAVRNAPKYPEGRGVRLAVAGEDDMTLVSALLEAKRGGRTAS